MSDHDADGLLARLSNNDSSVAQVLEVGLQELPVPRLTELLENLTDAEDLLVGALFNAAMRSERIEAVCPDTPEALLNPTYHRFRIREDTP
jgi:hypothetical protein